MSTLTPKMMFMHNAKFRNTNPKPEKKSRSYILNNIFATFRFVPKSKWKIRPVNVIRLSDKQFQLTRQSFSEPIKRNTLIPLRTQLQDARLNLEDYIYFGCQGLFFVDKKHSLAPQRSRSSWDLQAFKSFVDEYS